MKIKPLLHFLALSTALLSMLAGAQGQSASISGLVFFDLNGNGTRDAVSEYGLPAWTLHLVPVSPAGPALSASTDVNGRFNFGALTPGDYELSAVHPPPWSQTFPAAGGNHSITLAADAHATNQNFGCKQPGRVPQVQWQKNFGGIFHEDARAVIQQTSDGGYVIGGQSQSPPGGVKTSPHFGGYDLWIVRLDALGNQLWDRSFGGSADEDIYALQQTADGGFILAGNSYSGISGNKTTPNFGVNDYWIVRLDANGDKLWERNLGGSSTEGADVVIETRNGEFLVGGVSHSDADGNKTVPSFGSFDFWVLRLDANGNTVWEKAYGGPVTDWLSSAVEDSAGNFWMGGFSNSGPGGNKTSLSHGGTDFWLVKIDPAGNVLRDWTFGGSGEDYFSRLARTADGGLVLGGRTTSDISGNKTAVRRATNDQDDVWLVRVDANGTKLWDDSYGGVSGGQNLSGLQVMRDDTIVFSGYTVSGLNGNKISPSFGDLNAWMVRTDAAGHILWDQTFGGSEPSRFRALTATRDGGAIVTGYTYANDGNVAVTNHGGQDIWVVKLAPFACPSNAVTLVSAVADCGQESITVNFSAPLDPATALLPGNYTLSGGAGSVQAVSFGASTLQVVLGVPGLLPGVTYTLDVHGLADDCGNVIAANAQLTMACPGEIRGKIFSDQNTNCVENRADFRLPNWPVRLEPGPRYTLTDDAGNYSFTVPAGAYTVSAVDVASGSWARTCPADPGTYAVSVTNGQIAGRRDFGMVGTLSNACADLWVQVSADYPGPKLTNAVTATPCCGEKFTYRIDYGNWQTATLQATGASIDFTYPIECMICEIKWDPNCPVIVVPTPPTQVTFFIQNPLLPGDQCWIEVQVQLTCDIMEPCLTQISLAAGATIFPLAGDCNEPDNNPPFLSVKPCCSFDPNDCTVTPKGCGPEGLIAPDQALTYVVRFQNLGGGAAHLVVVRNFLDADLDESTLEVLGSSHPNYLERNGRDLTWIFPNIELASVHVEEAASHGYVKFRARPRADAPVGTVITNSAEITFDINDSITTITTTNTITDAPLPRAAFVIVPHRGSAGYTNDFRYTGGTTNAQHRWNFGPAAVPQTSTELNPAGVRFTQPGPHLVALETRLGDCTTEPVLQSVMAGLPSLGIARTGAEATLSWRGAGYSVQETDSLTSPVPWRTVPVQPVVVGGWSLARVPVSPGARFYRLTEAP